VIDSRDFIAARRRAETEVMLPAGPKIAFTGGRDCNDTDRDLGRARPGARQARRHGPAARRIADGSRAHRCLLGRQPQGRSGRLQARLGQARQGRPVQAQRRHAERAADRVVVFPGNGINNNLADKARKLGIPLFDFRKGGA
jgi:hypothetical protein